MGEGYTPPPSAGGGGAVSSVAGRTGDVVLAVADVSGAAPTASPSFSGTVTLPSGLVLPASVVLPSTADISAKLGSSSTTAAAGNDSRITGAAQKASNLSDLASAATALANLGAAPSSGIAPSAITGTAVVTADSRLSDPRTPAAHKTSHATGGSDAIAASDIGAASTALVTASAMRFAPHSYCSTIMPQIALNNIGTGGATAGRSIRIMVAETGFLRDVSVLIQASSGNSNILIFDTGQANATHTTRTVLGAKGSTATPAAAAWLTYDPDLAVTAGDTLELMWAADNATAHVYCSNTALTGAGTLPNTNFAPSSGAGTTSQVIGSNQGSMFALTAGSTVAAGSWTASDVVVMFVWRIASS